MSERTHVFSDRHNSPRWCRDLLELLGVRQLFNPLLVNVKVDIEVCGNDVTLVRLGIADCRRGRKSNKLRTVLQRDLSHASPDDKDLCDLIEAWLDADMDTEDAK